MDAGPVGSSVTRSAAAATLSVVSDHATGATAQHAVMQNTASFDLVWPEEGRSRKPKEVLPAPENEAPFDRDLFEILRKTRAALAQEQGGVPHYLIFPD